MALLIGFQWWPITIKAHYECGITKTRKERRGDERRGRYWWWWWWRIEVEVNVGVRVTQQWHWDWDRTYFLLGHLLCSLVLLQLPSHYHKHALFQTWVFIPYACNAEKIYPQQHSLFGLLEPSPKVLPWDSGHRNSRFLPSPLHHFFFSFCFLWGTWNGVIIIWFIYLFWMDWNCISFRSPLLGRFGH